MCPDNGGIVVLPRLYILSKIFCAILYPLLSLLILPNSAISLEHWDG